MPKAHDMNTLVGKTFNRLTIIGEVLPRTSPRKVYCDCLCGKKNHTVLLSSVLGKPRITCGCKTLPIRGTVQETRSSGECKVVDYVTTISKGGNSYSRLLVKFLETGYETLCSAKDFKIGNVKDVFKPSIAGVGFVGSQDANTTDKAYQTWNDMLKRCYAPKSERVARLYEDCTVAEDWHNYSNFKKWYLTNYIEGYQIDKDLRVLENTVYSSETCTMVPPVINAYVTGGLKTGVHYNKEKGKWIAQCQCGETTKSGSKKQTYLGTFSEEKSALKVYKDFKIKRLRLLEESYPELPDFIWANLNSIIRDL